MNVGKLLILVGVALVLVGALWLLGERIGLGRLPGDIVIRRERFTLYYAGPPRILGEAIPEAFVARALATPHDVAAADDLAGVVSYERLLVGALLMARRFAGLPGAISPEGKITDVNEATVKVTGVARVRAGALRGAVSPAGRRRHRLSFRPIAPCGSWSGRSARPGSAPLP